MDEKALQALHGQIRQMMAALRQRVADEVPQEGDFDAIAEGFQVEGMRDLVRAELQVTHTIKSYNADGRQRDLYLLRYDGSAYVCQTLILVGDKQKLAAALADDETFLRIEGKISGREDCEAEAKAKAAAEEDRQRQAFLQAEEERLKRDTEREMQSMTALDLREAATACFKAACSNRRTVDSEGKEREYFLKFMRGRWLSKEYMARTADYDQYDKWLDGRPHALAPMNIRRLLKQSDVHWRRSYSTKWLHATYDQLLQMLEEWEQQAGESFNSHCGQVVKAAIAERERPLFRLFSPRTHS